MWFRTCFSGTPAAPSEHAQSANTQGLPDKSSSLSLKFGTASCAVAIGFLTLFGASGTYYSYGAFFPVLLERYGASKFSSALVGASQQSVYEVACIPLPIIIRRYGIVKSYIAGSALFLVGLLISGFVESLEMRILTHSLVTTSGMAFIFMVALEASYVYTPRRYRGMCVGLTFAGSDSGATVISQAFAASERTRGLFASTIRFACIIGAIQIVVIAFVWAINRYGFRFVDQTIAARSEESQSMEKKHKASWLADIVLEVPRWFSNRTFVSLFVAFSLYVFGVMAPFAHLMQYCRDVGIDDDRGAIVLSVLGVSSAVGGPLFGALGDLTDNYLYCFMWTAFQNSVSVFLLTFLESFEALIPFAVFCGVSTGGREGLMALVCVELFGQEQASSAYAVLRLASCFSQTLGSSIVGLFHGVSGSYTVGFLIAGAAMMFSVPVLLGIAKQRPGTTPAAMQIP